MSYALTSTRYCLGINFHPVEIPRFVVRFDLSEDFKEPIDNNFKGSA